MSILLETRCSNFIKMLAQIALYERGILSTLKEHHYLQYKFHIASCAQCFYRAEQFVEKKREFCSYLFKVPKYIYSAGDIPNRALCAEYADIFPHKMPIEKQEQLKKHVSECSTCQYWERVTTCGWILSEKQKVLSEKQKNDLHTEIQDFLRTRNWSCELEGNIEKYTPPPEFGNKSPLLLKVASNITEDIKSIYKITQEQLDVLLKEKDLLFSIQTVSKKTQKGSIPFLELKKLMEKLTSTLTKIASFVVCGETSAKLTREATTYLSGCNFLQTGFGSFVSNIQLPSGKTIKSNLFENIVSDRINEQLISVIEFVVENVFHENENIYDPEYIKNHKNIIQHEILKDISDIIFDSNNLSMKFSFQSTKKSKIISTGEITGQKLDNMLNYLDFLKEEIEETHIEIEGHIIELHSQDPNSNNNRVVIKGAGEKKSISFVLDSKRYQRAIQAHENGQEVLICGKCKRLKTTIRVTKLEKFNLVSENV